MIIETYHVGGGGTIDIPPELEGEERGKIGYGTLATFELSDHATHALCHGVFGAYVPCKIVSRTGVLVGPNNREWITIDITPILDKARKKGADIHAGA